MRSHAIPPPAATQKLDRGDHTRAQKIRTVELEGKTIKLQIVRIPASRPLVLPHYY